MAIDSVRGAQQTQAPKKNEKKETKEDKTYDCGELCYVICTPNGNKVSPPVVII